MNVVLPRVPTAPVNGIPVIDVAPAGQHPVYARVDGSLPPAELPTRTPDIAYLAGQQFRAARFALQVVRGGNVTFTVDDPVRLELYVGERKIEPVRRSTSQRGRTP